MVEHDPARLDAVFQALSDATRRGMLRTLADGARTVGELAAPHAMSLAGASKHVKMLEKAGLVRRRVQGRSHLCSLDPQALAEAGAWLSVYGRFLDQRSDVMELAAAGEDGNDQ